MHVRKILSEYAKIVDKFTEGADCQGLASMHCSTMIGGWTVGYSGTCLVNENYAYRIGKNDFRHALVEVPSFLIPITNLLSVHLRK